MAESPHQEYYSGRMVWLPCVDQIRAGDILLTSNVESGDRKGLKQSAVIRRITKGRFSHVLMCSSPPTFVEAIGSGVSTLSLARCFAHDLKNVRVLRYSDERIAGLAAQLVQQEIGRDYSVARAVRTVFPLDALDRIDDHGTFCSALVAQVFANAGASEFKITSVDRTTPATIEKLACLEDLTEGTFRCGLAPNNIEEMSALDGDRSPTPSARQTQLSAECARALWPQADALAKRYPAAELEPTPTFYGLLKLVCDAVDRADRMSSDVRVAYLGEVAELDAALAEWLRRGELDDLLTQMMAIDDAMIERNLRESFETKPDIDLFAMRAYLESGRQQLADRLRGIENWEKWGPEKSAALSAYLPIDRKAAEATRQRNIVIAEILERCR